MTGLSAEQLKILKNDQAFLKGASIFEYYSRQFVYIGWNMDGSNPFFGDRRVWQAEDLCHELAGRRQDPDGHGEPVPASSTWG
jgi:hypothetical protein